MAHMDFTGSMGCRDPLRPRRHDRGDGDENFHAQLSAYWLKLASVPGRVVASGRIRVLMRAPVPQQATTRNVAEPSIMVMLMMMRVKNGGEKWADFYPFWVTDAWHATGTAAAHVRL